MANDAGGGGNTNVPKKPVTKKHKKLKPWKSTVKKK